MRPREDLTGVCAMEAVPTHTEGVGKNVGLNHLAHCAAGWKE